jgi:hypothetical protein
MAVKLGLEIYEWVNRFARRLAAKPNAQGIMQIPNQEVIRDLSNDILTKFMKHNVPRDALKSENDIKVIYNQIKNMEAQTIHNNMMNIVRKGAEKFKTKKSGDVLDLTGKKIDTSKPIQGGKNVPETEEQILERLNRQNKESIERLKNKKLTDPENLAHGGRTGTGLNYLLGEDDQNMRVPYGEGSSWDQFQKEKLMQKWQEYQQYLKNREKEKRQKPYIEERLGTGPGPVLEAAEGGRARFGAGGMGRRAFLKLMAALGATGVAAKSGLATLLKGGAKKSLTSVPIKAGADGMPVWFKPLVNRVIKEGEDVSKKASTLEREIVHRVELPGSKTKVYVTQDLNTGDVLVDIGASKHGFSSGKYGQPVRLNYKAAEEIEPILAKHMDPKNPKGEWLPNKGQKTKEEFWVEEAEFTGGHPENIKFEESTFEKFGKHESDFSEVEAFAKGKTKKDARKVSESLQKQNEDLADHFSNYPEPDDFASGGRVPLDVGGSVIDPELDDMDPDEWLHIIKLLRAGEIGAAEGGRVPMVFGGRTIGVLKNLLSKMKKGQGVGRGEKSLKPDIFAKSIMSEEDKLKLLQLETKYADSALESLKLDRQLFKQLETNKAMKDQGLDFLMKHFVDTQTPHMKNYKSLADIDQAILELETLVKNKTLKEGRHLNATGGRVPFAAGKGVMKLLKLLQKKFPGTTKLGQTSRPMAPKTELKQAIAGFQERNAPKVWENPDKVRAAVDDIFSSGDYKYDAEMAAEALVENNPADFGGKLIDDIDDATRSEIYGAVLRVVQSDLAKTLQLKRLSRPTKTLEGIKKTGKINISDDAVADEFSRFMKETDPKGFKDIEQKIQIESFDPKGRKKNAFGGLAGMLGE